MKLMNCAWDSNRWNTMVSVSETAVMVLGLEEDLCPLVYR